MLHLCDIILVMTVNPGFGGQSFLPEMLPKIRRIRALCAERGLDPVIEVDGGENEVTAGQAAAAGATAIVAGSAIFGTEGLCGGDRRHPRERHRGRGQVMSSDATRSRRAEARRRPRRRSSWSRTA